MSFPYSTGENPSFTTNSGRWASQRLTSCWPLTEKMHLPGTIRASRTPALRCIMKRRVHSNRRLQLTKVVRQHGTRKDWCFSNRNGLKNRFRHSIARWKSPPQRKLTHSGKLWPSLCCNGTRMPRGSSISHLPLVRRLPSSSITGGGHSLRSGITKKHSMHSTGHSILIRRTRLSGLQKAKSCFSKRTALLQSLPLTVLL